jgi:hypothetical protein
MKSILSLPPVLQTVWTAAYAAVVQGEHSVFGVSDFVVEFGCEFSNIGAPRCLEDGFWSDDDGRSSVEIATNDFDERSRFSCARVAGVEGTRTFSWCW